MDFIRHADRIYAENTDGTVIAEITFPEVSQTVVSINRTFVDNSLRGQGVAALLVEEVVAYARKHEKKIRPVCSYAVAWFGKHPEHADILETL